MRNRYQRGQNPWMLLIGIIVILSILFTIFAQRSQNTLDVYTKSDKVAKEDLAPEEEPLDIETKIHTDSEHQFSIEIPTDWQEVTKDGYTTFIHSPSSSSIQLQVLPYTPDINNASMDLISTQIAGEGKTFKSFEKTGNDSYQLLYQDFQNSTYDYIEEVFWDRETIIKLVCTFNDKNYEKIMPYYERILDSFAWKKPAAIPENYRIGYHSGILAEVLVPESWEHGSSENTLVATDTKSGATEMLTVMQKPKALSAVTATDMAGLLNKGQKNFMMSSFTNQEGKAVAKCTYVTDNVQYSQDVYVFEEGEYLYFLFFDYEQGTVPEELPMTCVDSFRVFIEEKMSENVSNGSTGTGSHPQPENGSTGQIMVSDGE